MESSNKNMTSNLLLISKIAKTYFHCADIRANVEFINFGGLDYDMIYGGVDDQEKFVKVYHLMLQARKDMLDKK